MIDFYLAKIKSSPLGILWIVFSLILIGLISLNSISVIDSQSSSGAFKKQLIFLIPSILLMFGSLLLSKKFIHERIYYICSEKRFSSVSKILLCILTGVLGRLSNPSSKVEFQEAAGALEATEPSLGPPLGVWVGPSGGVVVIRSPFSFQTKL